MHVYIMRMKWWAQNVSEKYLSVPGASLDQVWGGIGALTKNFQMFAIA